MAKDFLYATEEKAKEQTVNMAKAAMIGGIIGTIFGIAIGGAINWRGFRKLEEKKS